MDSLEGAIGESNKWKDYLKKKLVAKDVIISTYDPVKGTIEYSLNGKEYVL
jgi:hypothetical protein